MSVVGQKVLYLLPHTLRREKVRFYNLNLIAHLSLILMHNQPHQHATP